MANFFDQFDEARPKQTGNVFDQFDQPAQTTNFFDQFDVDKKKQAAPEESGIWTTAADFAKKMLGPAISGVAGLPLGTEEALKGAVRKSAEGEIDASVPVPLAIARALGKSAERLMPGSTTEEQRSLATQRALASLPEIPGARALNTFGKNVQESIEDSISAQTQQAVKESEITGNIFKGEIDFGSNPTVRGYAMQAASVLGSMGPVIAAAIVTKSPTAAGVTGGTMAAGEAANTAADYINKLPHEKLLTASPFYASMIAGGASEEEARKLTINKAAETGAVLQGLVATFGGQFTGKLVTGAFDDMLRKATGKSVAARTVATAGVSGAEEGAQEVAEGLASDIGLQTVVPSKELGEGSAANLVLGALGGAGPGGVRGLKTSLADRTAAKKPAGKTILDTLAGDEDVAGINEPAGGESFEVVGESGARRPAGGLGGAESGRVVPPKQTAGRLDDGEKQPAATLTAFDDFSRQYSDLRQEANEIYTSPTRTSGDAGRERMINRDLASLINANTDLIGDAGLARKMKNIAFDASRELSAIRASLDTGDQGGQPRAMQGDLAGTRKDILDLTNRALAIGRQDVGKAVEYLQGLQQRSRELLPEQSTDSFWGRRTAPLVGMTTAEGFANPKKVADLYSAQQEREIAEAIQRLQSTGQPRAMQGDLFASQRKEEADATAAERQRVADEQKAMLEGRAAERETKRDEFGAPIEGEPLAGEVTPSAPSGGAAANAFDYMRYTDEERRRRGEKPVDEATKESATDETERAVEPLTDEEVEVNEKEDLANLQAERIAETVEGKQIVNFFDAIKPSSTKETEQEKHGQPKRSALRKLLSFDIAKPGEETSPGVQAALRYLANRVGGLDSFQKLLSRLQAAPAELQSGMFTRAGLPDLTTRRGMEEFSGQVQSYLDQSSGKGTGVQISKKSAAAPATGSFRGVMPYTEDISQGVSETVEYTPLSSGKPRRPEQRTVSKTYKISDTKLRSAVRVLRERVQLGGKLSAPAKAASTYLQNSSRETFGDALRDVAYDLAMFELSPRNYGANSTFYGEGGKYAQEFRTWIEQNLDAETIKLLDDLIADHKATAEANAAFEKSVTSYRKQLEDRAEKNRVETEKAKGVKIPKAPKQRSQRITETELGEQEETAEPEIPAKNLPRTRKLYEVHPAIKRAVEAGDTKLVLELMAQSKSDPYFALLAQRLLDANITAKTQLVSADEMSPLSTDPGVPATFDGYLTALRDLVITTLPQGKQGEIVRQLESNKLGELVEAFDSINNESGNFTDGQRQLLTDSAKFFNVQYNWNGKYDPNTDTMSLRVGALTNHLFLHEAVHATAEHLISRPDSLTGVRRQGYDQLNELFNHSKAMLALKGLTDSTIYGLTDLHEFVSEAMTNPEFQATLRAIRYKASPYSLLDRFTNGIRKLFKVVDTAESNVLNEVIFATDAMLMGGVAGKELMTGVPRAATGKRTPMGRPNSKTAIKNMMSSRSWSEVKAQWPIFYSSLKASLRPIALGGLTLNQLGDLVNKRIPQVGNFIRVTEEYLSRKNQILNESGAISKRWHRMQVVNPDMSNNLGAVMHRATLSEVDPDRATTQQRNQNVDLMTQWNALSPEAKQIYRDVRNFYEKRFSEYKRTLKKRVQLMRQYGVSETTVNKIRDEFEKDSRKGPYFPLMRYGRFWYQVGKGGSREYYMFESLGQLQVHLNERLERNPELESTLKQDDQYQTQMDLHARESTFLKSAFDAVDKSSMVDKQGLKDELYQTWLTNQPETSFRNRFIHRKAVEGFSQDALRNFSASSFHMAYQMSRFEYSPEMFSQITAARAQIKERKDPTNRANLDVMRENNELSDYVQELERRMSTILNPEDVGKVVSILSNVGFIYYLTSVASAATNVLGGMVIGLPTLVSHQIRMNPKLSYTAATMASLGQMKNAAMQIMATGFSIDRGPRLRDSYVLFPSLDRSGSMSKMDRAAYNRFVADGVIDITAAYDQSGLASAPTESQGGALYRGMQAVSALFHNAERFNREVVAMSAFRAGMEKRAGYKDQQKAFAESIADAKNVTTQSMFDYSSVNKPRYMQSPTARVILQFKQFPQQMTYFLVRNLQHSLVGATPEVKREARARFVGTMGMTAIFAGSTGLWGFSTVASIVNAVVNGLGDDDEEPFDFELEYMNWAVNTFGKNLGMFLTRGAGNAAGVDLHSRVSLDDMWFRDTRKNADMAEAWQERLISLLGPTAGLTVNVARAVDLYNQGHADRALEAVSPGFIKQPLIAARYAREGVNTLKGDSLVQDVGPMDLLMQSMGFRPALIAEIQYRNITKKGQEQEIVKLRGNLLNLFGISFMANDADANQVAFDKIMKFNAKHPTMAIPADSIIKSIAERMTKSAMADHGLHIDKRLQGLMNETYINILEGGE